MRKKFKSMYKQGQAKGQLIYIQLSQDGSGAAIVHDFLETSLSNLTVSGAKLLKVSQKLLPGIACTLKKKFNFFASPIHMGLAIQIS